MTYLIPLVSTAVLELVVLRRLRFGWLIIAIALAGIVVDTSYLTYTSIFTRNYDGPSHVLYIEGMAEHLRPPPVSILCMVCGHPPLCYALAALWSKTVLAGGFIPRELGLQWLSLLLSAGFVVFALLLLRSTIDRPATLRLAAALVVLWPSTILNSVRVHNDALASLLIVASMYFIAQWDRYGRPRDFYLGVATPALALLTKASGYAVAATILVVAAWQVRSTRLARHRVRQLVAAALVLLCTALLATSFRPNPQPTLCRKVLGLACDVPRETFTSNRPSNYLLFDVSDFLSSTSSLNYPPKEDYFMNGVAKSSLFGVMPLGKEFGDPLRKQLAVVISLLLLAMVVVYMATLPFVRSVEWPRYRALVVASATLVVLLAAFHILLPTSFHEDFRHIFPALVPFCLLYAKVVERLQRSSAVLYGAGMGIGLLMIASSVAFFVRMP